MVPVPRPITGSIGSRVRVILGKDGEKWLLLLNHDNGDLEWQVKDWENIPQPLSRQINNCTVKGRDVKAVDFGPTGALFVRCQKSDGSGNYSWWDKTSLGAAEIKEAVDSNSSVRVSFGKWSDETYIIIGDNNDYTLSDEIHNLDLWVRIYLLRERSKSINFVRLFNDGQYFISDELGTKWKISNDDLEAELRDNSNGRIEDVAVSDIGDWVVIRHNSFASSDGVGEDLREKLTEFFTEQRLRVVNRSREIREANTANEAHSIAFNAAREAVEREERELFLRHTREAERATNQETAAADIAQINAATRISSLEATLEKRLIEEANDIKETEEKLRETKEKLLNRKRSFREAMQSMPPGTQSRITLDDSNTTDSNNVCVCVICHDAPSVMAVIPCGHVCLCNACSDVCMTGQNGQPTCPLCRGAMQSVLRIYLGN